MLILTFAAALSTAAATASAEAPVLKVSDPLAPARSGKMLCQAPDRMAKSCQTLFHYDFAADGAITSEFLTQVSNQPWINAKVTVPATVRDGKVCTPFEGNDKAEVFHDGKAADADLTEKVRKTLTEIYAPFAGQELCTSFSPKDDGYTTVLSIGEQVSPNKDFAIWVDPGDGWIVKR